MRAPPYHRWPVYVRIRVLATPSDVFGTLLPGTPETMAAPRMLVVFTSALAVVVMAFAVAIVVGEWWILPVALAAHLTGSGVVLLYLGRRILEDRDKPDPVTAARLEEEAVEESRNGSRRTDGSEGEERVFGH